MYCKRAEGPVGEMRTIYSQEGTDYTDEHTA